MLQKIIWDRNILHINPAAVIRPGIFQHSHLIRGKGRGHICFYASSRNLTRITVYAARNVHCKGKLRISVYLPDAVTCNPCDFAVQARTEYCVNYNITAHYLIFQIIVFADFVYIRAHF